MAEIRFQRDAEETMHLGLHCRVVVSIDHFESVIWLTLLVQIPEPAIFRSIVNVILPRDEKVFVQTKQFNR